MSSLMQFNGKVTRQGVHLQFYQTTESQKYIERWPYATSEAGAPLGPPQADYYLQGSETCGDATDGIYMPDGKFYPRIWTAVRKPRGMFGCWVVFQYNGKEHVPDLSCPIATFKLPRDARPMDNETCINTWKS